MYGNLGTFYLFSRVKRYLVNSFLFEMMKTHSIDLSPLGIPLFILMLHLFVSLNRHTFPKKCVVNICCYLLFLSYTQSQVLLLEHNNQNVFLGLFLVLPLCHKILCNSYPSRILT